MGINKTRSLVTEDEGLSASYNALLGGASNDVIYGSESSDTISGLGGNDTLYGLGGDDTLNGDDGDDTLYGGNGADTLNGGSGIDTIYGEAGNDIINGGAGNDIIYDISGENNFIDGGADRDTVFYLYDLTGVTVNYQSNGQIYVYSNGSSSNNFDVVTNIELVGGSGFADTINGSAGIDYFTGAGGNDTLFGNDGNDVINGGQGDDRVVGGYGEDTLSGGFGIDTIDFDIDVGNGPLRNLRIDLDATLDADVTSNSNGRLYEVDNNNLITYASNEIYGNFENVIGWKANDFIFGIDADSTGAGRQNNILDGRDGNDRLDGRGGNDTLIGGAGNDIFVFSNGADHVIDFQNGVDHVEISSIFGASNYNQLNIAQSGANTVIALGANSLTLNNFLSSNLDSSDFFFVS